jgi:hypothetical protein
VTCHLGSWWSRRRPAQYGINYILETSLTFSGFGLIIIPLLAEGTMIEVAENQLYSMPDPAGASDRA